MESENSTTQWHAAVVRSPTYVALREATQERERQPGGGRRTKEVERRTRGFSFVEKL
jgi:hypothetical protein